MVHKENADIFQSIYTTLDSAASMQKRYQHNFRLEDYIPNAEMALGKENEELVDKTGMNYIDLWHRRIAEVEIATGKNVRICTKGKNASILAYEFVTTFSRDANVDIDLWKEANVRFMQQYFGAENVLSMQLHRDEAGCEHIHSIVVPIDSRGHLCAKSFTGGPKLMFALHDAYGKAMEPLGLSRGEKFSRSKKVDLRKFYASLNKAATATVPDILKEEPVEEYVERVNEYLQTKELAHLNIEAQMKRRAEVAETQNLQLLVKYDSAIELFHLLMDKFDDEELVKKRLHQYIQAESSIPQQTLEHFLSSAPSKFPQKNDTSKYREVQYQTNISPVSDR